MNIKIKKWGNSLGFLIPHKIVESFGFRENSTIELTESKGYLIITKKLEAPSLDELLDSIPTDFQYPHDVIDFVDSSLIGQELL
ncbi:AbrB/MazE/SpoVT family DNA-binding domain-containing protein [Pseudanabaena mucicola]|uniref:AbrB/MazE/SpoVT family DNA-binding domain-containing protein n=1 Tax=Pseudanabaena mucicola FACHB-723 TaxID=2692860 RepID=A0ABR7ZSR1_9CYAN|nr:AbrB/MazE/SpoVT family DNA-binding domain-containing protein [Pseudanabaena mucicola]MBD2186847.1 AbrB/MazE/SpoVT family DNA-binding domain-containing protein [Pseudanabaena mucicola FACHB-723]